MCIDIKRERTLRRNLAEYVEHRRIRSHWSTKDNQQMQKSWKPHMHMWVGLHVYIVYDHRIYMLSYSNNQLPGLWHFELIVYPDDAQRCSRRTDNIGQFPRKHGPNNDGAAQTPAGMCIVWLLFAVSRVFIWWFVTMICLPGSACHINTAESHFWNPIITKNAISTIGG